MIIDGKRYSFITVYKVKGEKEYLYVLTNNMKGEEKYLYGLTNNMKGEKEYLYVLTNNMKEKYVFAYLTLQEGDMLPSCHGDVSRDYLHDSCTRVTFKKLPCEVQKHVRDYILYASSN